MKGEGSSPLDPNLQKELKIRVKMKTNIALNFLPKSPRLVTRESHLDAQHPFLTKESEHVRLTSKTLSVQNNHNKIKLP